MHILYMLLSYRFKYYICGRSKMEGYLKKPLVGVILGDPAGIGPEIVLKMLMRPSTYIYMEPVLIGNYKLLCNIARIISPNLFFIKSNEKEVSGIMKNTGFKGIPVVDIEGDETAVTLGKISKEGGRIAYSSIICGYHMLEQNIISGLIMGPINKEALARCGCGYKSEYEVFAKLANTQVVQSVVKGGELLRSTVIGHVPFRRILELLTVDNTISTGMGLYKVLRQVINQEPKICIAALNPHGGEGGMLGEEEQDIIIPAIEHMQKEGIQVDGPYPSDTIYTHATSNGYNGIIYLYHDQGNIAMKAKIFETTALIYTNVPYPILSTGHGSALDIANLGIANPTNLCYVMSTLASILQKLDK